jgi:hypothetical protein
MYAVINCDRLADEPRLDIDISRYHGRQVGIEYRGTVHDRDMPAVMPRFCLPCPPAHRPPSTVQRSWTATPNSSPAKLNAHICRSTCKKTQQVQMVLPCPAQGHQALVAHGPSPAPLVHVANLECVW